MQPLISNDWQSVLAAEFASESYQQLRAEIQQEYQNFDVYPKPTEIFQAFEWTSFKDTKVVILGQDPYHEVNQAHGLSFSVLPGVKIPPSLRNIYKELQSDLGFEPVNHGYLKSWAKQGVLLLNAVLTVRQGQANSHQGKGWEAITDAAIRALSQRDQPVVFILWGKSAQAKRQLIDAETNIIIESAHPSPLSAYRGFFGSKPFSKTNQALKELGEKEIDWKLPDTVQLHK